MADTNIKTTNFPDVIEGSGPSHEFDLSLIIVATNVRVDLPTFTEMIDAFRRVFHESNVKAEILVVDDGVGGAFYETLQQLNREIPNFKVIRFRRTFGESIALRIAVERARSEYIITNAWYLQVKPEAVLEVLKKLKSGSDFVATRRTPRVDSVLAQIQSWGFNRLTEFLTNVKISDLNCSFRGFKRQVLEQIQFHGDLFRFVPILAIAQGFTVAEQDVKHLSEKGPSTFLNFSLYVRRFLDIFSLFFLMKFIQKPLRFFGLTGISLFLVGFIISSLVAFDKLVNDIGALDRPELVLGVFLMVLGPILSSIGLIGEIIIFTQGKQTSDYHIDTILGPADIDTDREEGGDGKH